MNLITARKRNLISSIFLLGITFATSGCSALQHLSLDKNSETSAARAKPEERGVVVYAIHDIPEGSEITAESLENRELALKKIPQDAIVNERVAIGRLAKYGIATGQIISQYDLAPQAIGHSVNVSLSNAAYARIRRVASLSGQSESDLVSSWIAQKLSDETTTDE
jgi:Flp pilus assembly protein CpaB